MYLVQILYFLIAVGLFNGCSKDYYTVDGKRYKIYKEVDLKGDLSKIQALDLSGTMSDIPSAVFSLPNLVYLNISEKGLDSIPSEICNLDSMKALLFNQNVSISIPECLYEMDNLRIVSFFGCRLDSIPRNFGNMQQLEVLVIMGNNYTEDDLIYLQNKLPNSRIVHSID